MRCRPAVPLTLQRADSHSSLCATSAKRIPHCFNGLRTLTSLWRSESEVQPLSSHALPHSCSKTAGCHRELLCKSSSVTSTPPLSPLQSALTRSPFRKSFRIRPYAKLGSLGYAEQCLFAELGVAGSVGGVEPEDVEGGTVADVDAEGPANPAEASGRTADATGDGVELIADRDVTGKEGVGIGSKRF